MGGLNENTDELRLRSAFGRYGEVLRAEVMLDQETERSRRFGFVTMAGPKSAKTAMCALDGSTLDGHPIRVHQVIERLRGARR